MHFLLRTLKVVYVLTMSMPELLEDATVKAIKIRAKWKNDDYICGGHILNGMSDSLFDVYTNVESAKELWDLLESKYMGEDSSSKKFLVGNFNNYKMVDSRPVMEQYNELFRILGQYTQHGLKMDECISVSSIIDKLPPSWKDFKHTLKHGKDDLSLVQLGSPLHIEESLRAQDSDKGKGKEVSGPSVNMTEEGGIAEVVKRTTQMLVVRERGLRTNPKTKVDAIAWWIDSGATTHVCKDRCWFQTYEPVEDGSLLYMGDDHFAPVHGKGSVYESDKYILSKYGVFVGFGYYNNGHVHYKRMLEMSKDELIPAIDENYDKCTTFEGSRDQVGLQYSYCYSIEEDPRTYNEAMQSRDSAFWKEAIDDEIGFIMENNTWVLYDLPPGCKWTFKRKMKVNGTVDKFKARLVIQGFRQKEWIYYFDTYAPVARITTIRLLLALAAIHNLVIHQMDVKTTFLNGDLDEEVYMKQTKGFIMSGNEHKVCKLVKSLYGLKQAPKQWHQNFDEVVLSSGFHLNQSDKCVYSKFDDSGKGVIICLYVDDMLIFGTDQNQVDKTKKFLSSRFSMKDMGEADVILGINIKRENKGIVITQSHYIEKILKKFNRENCSSVSTPMDPVKNLKPNTGKPIDQLEYSRAIGCLMYAMTSYSDASWINHVEDSSSTSGWVFLLGGGAISWDSKKQTCITGSTMESEFVALASVGKEAEWLRNLMHKIPIWSKPIAPISIRCDSAPTMARAYSQI
nr:zinc finger, CCHC-type [Tanacetum cinerariifolium]